MFCILDTKALNHCAGVSNLVNLSHGTFCHPKPVSMIFHGLKFLTAALLPSCDIAWFLSIVFTDHGCIVQVSNCAVGDGVQAFTLSYPIDQSGFIFGIRTNPHTSSLIAVTPGGKSLGTGISCHAGVNIGSPFQSNNTHIALLLSMSVFLAFCLFSSSSFCSLSVSAFICSAYVLPASIRALTWDSWFCVIPSRLSSTVASILCWNSNIFLGVSSFPQSASFL